MLMEETINTSPANAEIKLKNSKRKLRAALADSSYRPSSVPLPVLLDCDEFLNSQAVLPVAVGRDTEGKPKIIDLAEAPHILMAGATKQGKTTAVHSLILSLLRSRTSDELRFAFINPKGFELKAYKSLSSNYILVIVVKLNRFGLYPP